MIYNEIGISPRYRLDDLTQEQYRACQNYLMELSLNRSTMFKDEITMADTVRFIGNRSYDGESYYITVYADTEHLDVYREVVGEQFDIAEAYLRLREGIKELKIIMKELIRICEEL